MDFTTFDQFCSYISQCPPGSSITNYERDLVLPLNYDFPINNECSGPSLPTINAPHLCHARVPGSSHQDQFAPMNLPRFYAHQNMYDGEARSFNFPTAVSSWYPEPSMAGVLFSPSVSLYPAPSATLDGGQEFLIPDLLAGPGPQASSSSHPYGKCSQSRKTKLFTAPEEGPISRALSSSIGRTPKVRKGRSTRFAPINPRQEVGQGDAWSFNFPTNSLTPSLLDDSPQAGGMPSEPFGCGPTPEFPGSQPDTTITIPASDIASRPTPKILHRKGKISQNHKRDIIEGCIMAVEKENIKCIIGECPTSCASVNGYKAHLKVVHRIHNSHTSGNKTNCPVSGCAKRLGEGSVMRHILGHLDAIRMVCTICSVSFTRIDTLKSHITANHGGEVQKLMDYQSIDKESHWRPPATS